MIFLVERPDFKRLNEAPCQATIVIFAVQTKRVCSRQFFVVYFQLQFHWTHFKNLLVVQLKSLLGQLDQIKPKMWM